MQKRRPPLKFNFTARTTSTYSQHLNLVNGIVFFCLISTLYACYLVICSRFSNCSNSLNFEAKINFDTTKQNELKWRKTCTGLKFDLEHFNGPHIKFVRDSLYKHPVGLDANNKLSPIQYNTMLTLLYIVH